MIIMTTKFSLKANLMLNYARLAMDNVLEQICLVFVQVASSPLGMGLEAFYQDRTRMIWTIASLLNSIVCYLSLPLLKKQRLEALFHWSQLFDLCMVASKQRVTHHVYGNNLRCRRCFLIYLHNARLLSSIERQSPSHLESHKLPRRSLRGRRFKEHWNY